MLAEDDPRHGTYAGYAAHYKAGESPCEPCRLEGCRRRKLNSYRASTGSPSTVPSVGTVRRMRALMALGYTQPQIAREAGISLKTLRNPTFRGGAVYRSTHEAVAAAYERLCMRLPVQETKQQKRDASYARNLARRRGWAPPLAWDDGALDDPDAEPKGQIRAESEVDPVVVQRILDGDNRVKATAAERAEVCRQWVARGRSLAKLERLTGWKPERYYRAGDAA